MQQQIENTTNGEEALLQVIDAGVHELNQPMRAILCWSTLLLSETEPDSPLARDLGIIVEEAKRMSEVVRGLNLLT